MDATNDPVADFQAAMVQRGLSPPGAIVADGRLHRFDVHGDHKGSKNGYYKLHLDGRPAGAFGCWKRQVKETWKANGAPLNDFDHAALMREIKVEQKRRDQKKAKQHKETAEDAALLWADYKPAPNDHPYLVRKQVQPHGARLDGLARLVLSAADIDGEIWSLQTIDAEGGKLFMKGGRKQGCLFAIGAPGDRIVIAEGFATGASIHEATGLCVAVAFDAGNLDHVAQAIRAKRPACHIVIAADDDCETDGNPGLTKATAAAAAAGATVAIPARQQPNGKKLDFNDIAIAEGSEAVAAIIMRAFPEPEDAPPEPDPQHPEPENAAEPEDDWQERLAAAIAELNRTYFVAAMGGSARVASTVHDETMNRDRLVFSREADIKLLFAHRHYVVAISQKGNPIWKGLGEAWLNHAARRTFRQIALITDGRCPPDVYNLWRGFAVAPKVGQWPTIEKHLRSVVCSGREDHYKWLIGWLAYCVQYPGRQAEVAVVLRGLKGTGKGMVGQILMRIFRDHSLHITNSKHLVGNFNAHLVDALFLFLDEAFWAGDKQGEGTLKALITERSLMIEPKGVDSFQMPNRLKILMASNAEWVVPASADERRYFVLDVSDRRKGDKEYFSQLAAAIEGDELAAFLDYLLKLDIAVFDHRNPPHTDGLNKQKLIGGDSLQKFWLDCLTASAIVNAELWYNWPKTVPCADLHDAYIEHAHAHGDRHPLTSEQLSIRLRKLCPNGILKVVRPRGDGDETTRPRHFGLRSLEEHRVAFLKAMNIGSYDWPIVEVAS